jgi:hypothetical protein
MSHYHSLMDVHDASLLQAEELLNHCSPASVGSGDPALLDVDSDNLENSESVSENLVTMDTHTQDLTNTTNDPLYHQCKNAQGTSFTEQLVSISGDSTFGSSLTSISPPVGNLIDHEGSDVLSCPPWFTDHKGLRNG